MSRIENYMELELVSQTGYYNLLRVQHRDTGEFFLLKHFHRLNAQKIASLRTGVKLAQELKLDIILEPLEIFEQGLNASTLYRNIDAVSLRSFMKQQKKLNYDDFINVAKMLTLLTSDFHTRGWIIKNLSPENILIYPQTLECKLADLRTATRIFKKEQTDIYERADLQELYYISPEQTGRISQVTDHRSDLYALGLIFYELLTGKSPFNCNDALELIHAHLAVAPVALVNHDASIPQVLNDIVLKLINKSSEERYQSCEGLLYDLQKAPEYFSSANVFKIASKDKISKLVPTSRLIARKEELHTIETAYKAARAGKKQAVYISGYSGVGKTRIVQEFYKNKIADKVPIAASKFDTLQRNTPYSALLAAMKDLIRKLLREDDEKLHYWKTRFLAYLKENTSIIAEVIPEVEAITGVQPQVNPLPPDEAQKRFQQTFVSFIAAFSNNDQSFILFLDDLQWADIASIRLIELLLLDDSIKNFLFIGAYRDNEVDPTHALAISLRKQEKWVNLSGLQLTPLVKTETAELITETLHHPIKRADEFIELIYQKTGGNSFFTIQLLTVLFEENILFRDEEGIWQWDEKLLLSRNISDNVVEMLVQKITALSTGLQTYLKMASCLGDAFDLKTLSLLAGVKMNTVAGELSTAVNMGYLISMDENLDAFFRIATFTEEEEINKFPNTRFRFSHDRVRQASLSQVRPAELSELNLNAGRIKTKYLSEQEAEEDLFYIANHFIAGETLINDPAEKIQLATFAYRAGEKASNASAYDAAINYFNAARRYLNFQSNYQLLYDVYLKQAECYYLTGKYKEAETDLDILYNTSTSRIDKLNTLFVKVYLLNIQDNKLPAIEAASKGYKLFNIYMPRSKPLTMFLILKDLLIARIKLPDRKIDHILDLPLMQDAEQKRFQEFVLAVAPTIYQYDQNLFVWNIMRMLFPSLKKGNNGVSSFAYIGLGMVLSQLFANYKTGKKLANVAIQLNSKLGYTALKWKVRLSYYNFVQHWTDPVRPVVDEILDVENGAWANGDPIYAGYCIFIYHQKKYALGFHLKELQESFENYLRITQQRHDVETYHFLSGYYYAVRCLRGEESNTLLMGESYNAPQQLQKNIELASFSVVADTSIAYMGILFLFGHIEKALEQYGEAIKYTEFIQQRYEFAEFNFYAGLICAGAYEQKLSTKLNLKKRMHSHLKKLEIWKNHCADNFEPQYLIVSAEIAHVTGNGVQAMSLYEKAMQKADEFQFINYKALANELAGGYQYKAGNQTMSKTYLENARRSYQQWGAIAKVQQLETTYASLYGNSILQARQSEEKGGTASTMEGMDLNVIMQANRAVTNEKDIDSLVEQLMKSIIQYSGADNGYLLVKNRSELIIKAKYNSVVGVNAVTEYADNEVMPLNLVNYVTRLKEPLILNNAAQIPEYSNSKYFENHKPKSLICFPVLKQGEIFGVLYLENERNESVFDEKKINLLHVISSQIAVLLDNAFLYQNMESRVLERTEALEAEKGITEQMLENILPKAAIEELKRTGKTTAKKFDHITVLMADIKGFTNITEKLTPEELIGKIDFYFRSFDDIMMKYGLEKIKTIGDAYMAAGGLDGNKDAGAINMIAAALDMQKVMKENNNVAEEDKLELRIGIHTGTVIAGVVGFKKFQYDMWGDTVNIAARMEQQSEPGRVNVSTETYERTKAKAVFTYRGKIEAKNKGPMDMYFVEKLKAVE
jgi:predicted ATPase/class 3 adenylate cyclase